MVNSGLYIYVMRESHEKEVFLWPEPIPIEVQLNFIKKKVSRLSHVRQCILISKGVLPAKMNLMHYK